jgi:hypothetical protein
MRILHHYKKEIIDLDGILIILRSTLKNKKIQEQCIELPKCQKSCACILITHSDM